MPDPSERSHDTYRVTNGKLHHTNNQGERVTLTPGATFHPTLRQVEGGSLENKAVKVKEGSPAPSSVVTANIGLRSLKWGSGAALNKALDATPRLTVEEMQAVGASGETGFVSPDVDRALEARD